MDLKRLRVIGLLSLGISIVLGQNSFSQNKLAIHVTQEEIDIWKQRATSGPYKEEYDSLRSRANAFLNAPDPLWNGQTTDSCYTLAATGEPTRALNDGLRDTGLIYLITRNTVYRNAVLTQLKNQAAKPGTYFGNTKRWCTTNNSYAGHNNISIWLRKLTYAYSYIRSDINETDRKALDTWFRNAGRYLENTIGNLAEKRFPRRLYGDYNTVGSNGPGTTAGNRAEGLTHYGGHMAREWQYTDNKFINGSATFTAIGVVIDDALLKDRGKLAFKEWLWFGVWDDGVVFDQIRWSGDTPQHAYLYAGTAIGSALTIADHLARTGDTELYDFSTTFGKAGTEAKTSKTLHKVLQNFARMTNGTVRYYASNTATTNPDLVIDQTGPLQPGGKPRIEYVNIANNTYYNDSEVRKAYNRTLPSGYGTQGCGDQRGGDWCTYSGIRFLFGQMEGKVWPYPTAVGSTFSAPTNLRITE